MSTLVLKLLSYVKTKVEILLNFVPSQKIWILVEIKQFLIKLIWKWLNGFKKKEILFKVETMKFWIPNQILFYECQNFLDLTRTTFHYWTSPSELWSIFAILKMKLDFQKLIGKSEVLDIKLIFLLHFFIFKLFYR